MDRLAERSKLTERVGPRGESIDTERGFEKSAQSVLGTRVNTASSSPRTFQLPVLIEPDAIFIKEMDELILKVMNAVVEIFKKGGRVQDRHVFISVKKTLKDYMSMKKAFELLHAKVVGMLISLKTYQTLGSEFSKAERLCIPRSLIKEINAKFSVNIGKAVNHLDPITDYSKLNVNDFVSKFNESSDDLERKIEEALRRLSHLRNEVWDRQTQPESLKEHLVPIMRLDLFKLFECGDTLVQEKALTYLIEILDNDPFTKITSNNLIKLLKDILEKINKETVQNNDTSIQGLLIQTLAIVIEKRLFHTNEGNLSAITDELKQKTRTAEKEFADLKTKKMNVKEREFWNWYSDQAIQHTQSDVTKTEEWIKRLANLTHAGLSVISLAGVGVGLGDSTAVPDIVTNIINDISAAFKDLDWKEKKFQILLRLRRLLHSSRDNVVAFRAVVKIIHEIKHRKINSSEEVKNTKDLLKDTKEMIKNSKEEMKTKEELKDTSHQIILYGIITTLESTILWSHQKEVREEGIKLLIQLMTIDNPLLQYRGIMALQKIINIKENISTTAEVVLKILRASGFYKNKSKEITEALEINYTSSKPVPLKRRDSKSLNTELIESENNNVLKFLLRRVAEIKKEAPGVPSLATLLAQSEQEEITHDLFACLQEYPEFMGPDSFGNTAFHIATRAGNRGMVECIKKTTKIDINHQNLSGDTALHEAAKRLDVTTFETLLELGANPNVKNEEGNTALHIICMKQPKEKTNVAVRMIKLLKDKKADFNLPNDDAKFALNCAITSANIHLVEQIIEGGGKVREHMFQSTPLVIAAREGVEEIVKQFIIDADGKLEPHECLEILRYFGRLGNEHPQTLKKSPLAVFHLELQKNNKAYQNLFTRFSDWPFIDYNNKGEIVLIRPNNDSTTDILTTPSKQSQAEHTLLRTESTTLLPNIGGNLVMKFAKRSRTLTELKKHISPKNVNDQNDLGHTAASIATICNNIEGLKALIEQKADLNMPDIRGNRPLHFAAYLRSPDLMRVLLENGADPGLCNCYGDTPLLIYSGNVPLNSPETTRYVTRKMIVSQGTDTTIIDLMIDKNPSIIKKADVLGCNALHRAFRYGTAEMLKYLLSKRAFQELFWEKNNEDHLPVQEALKSDAAVKIKDYLSEFDIDYLLQLREDFIINTKNVVTFEALVAVSNLHELFAKVIEKNFSLALHQDSTPSKFTPLHYAAQKGHVAILLAYHNIHRGTGCDLKDAYGDTPLHVAAFEGKEDFVETWINCNYTCDTPNLDRRTALHYAAASGHLGIVKKLAAKYRNICIGDCRLDTPMHLAAKNGHKLVVKYLAELSAESINVANEDDMTPLHCATLHEKTDVVDCLLDLDAKVEATNTWGETPLFIAIQQDHGGIFEKLLIIGNANPRAINNEGETPLHAACFGKNLNAVIQLIERDEQLPVYKSQKLVDMSDVSSETPLHELTKVKGNTIIQQSIATKILEVLLKAGAEPDHRNEKGEAFVHIICYKGLKELLVTYLNFYAGLRQNIKLNFLVKDNRDNTMLHSACLGNQLEIVKTLKEQGIFPVNKQNNEGMTPLLICLKNGLTNIADFLMKHSADVTLLDKHKRSSLHYILSNQVISKELFGLLVTIINKSPHLLYSRDGQDNTVFHLIAKNNHEHVFKFVVSKLPGNNEEKKRLLVSQNSDNHSPFNLLTKHQAGLMKEFIEANAMLSGTRLSPSSSPIEKARQSSREILPGGL